MKQESNKKISLSFRTDIVTARKVEVLRSLHSNPMTKASASDLTNFAINSLWEKTLDRIPNLNSFLEMVEKSQPVCMIDGCESESKQLGICDNHFSVLYDSGMELDKFHKKIKDRQSALSNGISTNPLE